MHKRLMMLLLSMLLLITGRAAAQIAWDAPYLVPPAAPPGFGIYLMDVHGGSLGLMGAWRSRTGGYGLRAGIAESRDDDVGVFGGVDFSGRVHRANANFPLDVDWVFGAGLGVADWVRVSVPLGLTLGHTFRGDGATFVPYITPRIFLDAAFDDDREDDTDTDLGLAVDLGMDLRFARSGFIVRFGASLGDREAVAIGLVF
jgi:hypothetical protein